MSTTIESLQLEILSNSKSAESGLTALSKSLETLKTATKGGLGLSAIAKQLKSVSDATNSIDVGSIVRLENLASAIKSLSGIKISSSIGTQLTSISTALNGMKIDNGVSAKIEELTETLEPLSQMPKSNLSSYVTSIKKIPEVLTELNKVDMVAFKTKILEVTDAVKPLATEMNKIANGFSTFPSKLQKVITSNGKLANSNKKLKSSFTDLYHMATMYITALSKIGKTIYGFIEKASDYIENINLFNVAMGDYASEARAYAEEVETAMGIDPGEWMYSQGLFQTLITGFGVAGDSASKMSKNLTQLAYDLSSFYNIDVETAMQKLKSGMAGELEPLRAIGYDLSQAKLEATAAELGIDKAVSSMTQAEKAMLRYHAIMTQVTATHGDMARTLDQPANQLRVLKAQLEMLGREIGNVFMPLLKEVLPYLIAGTKVLREIVSAIALLVGYEAPNFEDSTEGLVSGSEDASEALNNATESAKKLKSYMLGFDELNVINPNDDSSDTALGAFDIDLPEYSFLGEETESKVAKIVEEMKEWLGITGEIDSWSDVLETRFGRILTTVGSIAGGLLLWKLSAPFLKNLDTLSAVIGATLLVNSILVTFQEGLSWKSIIEGAIGGALLGAGLGFKLGGWKGAIGGVLIGIGVSLIINGITSMIDEGVNVENVLTTITGLLAGVGGIITVIKLFNATHKSPIQEINTTTETISQVSTGTSTLTTKLTSLVKNLALGLVIIAEVAAAAILIVGAIWVLGKELEQVGIAWQPVIDNAGTVAIAMGVGLALLAGIGAVTALLGSVGTPLIVNLALGVAILAELGVATILFVAEILVIGLLLDEVGKAWQPVIDNGETIATGIGVGTALLVAIGAVAALLGVATVASAGLLPLAIALGTAMLVELALSFVAFTESLVEVADQLSENLHPSLDKASAILPGLSENMKEFTDFMGGFALEVVKYSLSSTIAGIASTIDKIIGFFTTDPVSNMAKEVDSQIDEFEFLIDGLEIIIPHIEYATELVDKYNEAMGNFNNASGNNKGLLGNLGIVKEAINGIISGIEKLANGVIDGINGMINALNKLSFQVPDWVPLIGGKKFGFNLKTISRISIPRFAEGGFPEQGQMFIAREAGPEMVGNIGRRTAVANNEQIVESISVGVAEANSEQNALLREQNSLLRALLEKDSGVYLDGRSLSDSVDKYKREHGRVLITGGAL